MNVAVVGKGGVGKTVVSGILSRALARQGWNVTALDCDSNPNLGISLGIGVDATTRLAAIRQALDQDETAHAATIEELFQRFGTGAPDGVRLAVVAAIDHPDPGCP